MSLNLIHEQAGRYFEREYDCAYFLHNPISTQPQKGIHYLERLRETRSRHGLSIMEVETSPYADGNLETLAGADEGTIIICAGGDGTKNEVTRSMRALNMSNAFLGLAAGNADDLPHSLHPSTMLTSPEQMLLHGVAKELKPLEIEAKKDGQTRHIQALGYFGVGISAISGATFNDRQVREKLKSAEELPLGKLIRQALEAKLALGDLHRSPELTVITADGERSAREVLIANGNRMAKHFRFPVNILQPTAVILEVVEPTIAGLAQALGRAAFQRVALLQEGEVKGFVIESGNGRFPVQADGEVTVFESGTLILVRLAERGVSVITTNWREIPIERKDPGILSQSGRAAGA